MNRLALADKTFSVVVPAYNEEQSIEGLLKLCVAARPAIRRETGLGAVEIICVDDGSRDRTREIAAKIPEVKLVVHPRNRGYGQALMSGFTAASGDYLGFLDADGTCDPVAFVGLFNALVSAKADMAVGNRLHGSSRMPMIREIGNRFYAGVISWLTGVRVRDAASGMRVFSRELLPRLSPLPTGLHFTPAMTARAACMGAKLVEAPIPYDHRQGESKLNVAADGVRFLRVILGIIFAYFPLRIFGPLGALFFLAAAAYGWHPVAFYLENRRLEEHMIYRLLTITTLTVCGLISWTYGLVAQRLSDIVTRRPSGALESPWLRLGASAGGAVLILGGVVLNSRTILEYLSSGRVTIHWVYVLTGGLAVICGTALLCFAVTLGILGHLPRALERG